MGTQRDDPSSRLPSPVSDSPRPVIKSLLLAPCTLLPALRRYFSSGWAFLIPYLVAYLLYWWLRWPVNAVAGEGAVKVASGSASLTSSLPHSPVPPLLYVYWALHAINLILAAIALVSWWRERRARVTDESRNGTPLAHGFPAPFSLPLAPSPAAKPRDEPSQSSEGAKAGRPSLPQSLTPSPPAPSLSRSLSLRIAPWFLLALVFWIPGFYIEWPSDPWEHLRRINEWATHDVAGEFSAGYKSFYFFAYSFVGRIPTGHEFVWLNVYYTGMCLLLSWHYYRLARATGLESRWAFLFVIVSALTFGNVTFSFFRYYGLASTTFAQIGAVALIRIAIEALKAPEQGARGKEQGAQDPGLRPKAPMSALRRCLLLLVPCSLLLLLVVFSHIQGIGIAGLGIGAVIVWRLIAWRRSMVWWLAVATILLSVATVLWGPRHPELDAILRPYHWLTPWYGFNLFSPSSPAFDRALQILGFFGVVNLAAGIYLLRRNHVAGWLTVAPVLALCLPFVAIPFANAIANSSGGVWDIIMFHRMLLAIPSGLALICVGRAVAARKAQGPTGCRFSGARVRLVQRLRRRRGGASSGLLSPFAVLLVSVTALTIVPPSSPYYNRFWHLLSVTPQDLQMKPVVSAAELALTRQREAKPLRLVATNPIACICNALAPLQFPYSGRTIGVPIVGSLDEAIAVTLSSQPTNPSTPTLTRDPMAADPSAWTTLVGPPPEFVAGIKDFGASSTALRNPSGHRCDVFTSALIPIDSDRDYCVECSATQRFGTNAVAYLAVAWYDHAGRLLESNIPAPEGADYPVGWVNGTYSYFGLVGNSVPNTWATYRTSFGPGEAAAIPARAKFVRVGAMLNYKSIPAATIEFTGVRLWRKSKADAIANGTFFSDERLLIVAPLGRVLWTCASQAAQASHHWPAQQVAVDLAGGAELARAARAAPGTPVGVEKVIYQLEAPASNP